MSTSPARTVVLFHAHPDDEALLTGGTMARLASQGHRVVLVVATSGELGLADPGRRGLGERRREELARSAAVLGVARTVHLGYADSGSRPVPTGASTPADRFADADLAEAARRLATVLREESADILTVYDEHGGYGHPDHVQVHRVGTRAAAIAGTPRVLEATVDRTSFSRAVRALRAVGRFVPVPDLPDERHAYTARGDLTHRIDVGAELGRKRAALRAHLSQQGGGGPRTVALLLRLPGPVARVVLGHEWFREVGAVSGGPLLDDLLAPARAGVSGRGPVAAARGTPPPASASARR